MTQPDPAVGHDWDGVAHGDGLAGAASDRVLVAVFASPVAAHLFRYGPDLGYRTVLVEPDPGRVCGAGAGHRARLRRTRR